MSQELLKKLLTDSENCCNKSKASSNARDQQQGLSKKTLMSQSKRIKKERHQTEKRNKKSKTVLSDKFKSLVKKMRISTDKNLILEKNLKHLSVLKERSKVAKSITNYLTKKMNSK